MKLTGHVNLTANFSSPMISTLSIIGCTMIQNIIRYLEVRNLKNLINQFYNDFYESLITVGMHQRFFTPQVNHISLRMPSSPPLSQHHALSVDSLCNQSTVANCEEKECACAYTLQVPLGSLVEVILIDEGR